MNMHYSEADRQLAKALMAVDVEAASSAVAAGAKAYRQPYRGISWALIPLYFKAAKEGLEANFDDAKQMMRNLIQAGSPIKGLAHFIGAGYTFSREEFNYLLDNWLWRDVDELQMVATRCLGNDEMMMQIIGTGQVQADIPVENGYTLFESICLNGLYRSAFEFCGLGANLNAKVDVGGEVMPLIEAAALKGHAGVVNALMRSGAFYDAESLAEKARRYSSQCESVVNKSITAFEMAVDLPDEEAHRRMTGMGADRDYA